MMKKSFTLVELLVVMFIIALFAIMTVVLYDRAEFGKRNNDNQRKKDINEIAAALEEFKADHGHYPFINWYNGKHAWEALNPTVAEADWPAECYTASGGHFGKPSNYIPSLAQNVNTTPGTEITFQDNESACDDLSLQLTGQAYLSKMPTFDPSASPTDQDAAVAGKGDWETTGSNLKAYLETMPRDPLRALGKWQMMRVCDENCSGGYEPTADYDPTSSYNELYRYYYNSYYKCTPENIGLGDRYWLKAITQLKKDGEKGSLDMYFYEIGNINFEREPKSICRG